MERGSCRRRAGKRDEWADGWESFFPLLSLSSRSSKDDSKILCRQEIACQTLEMGQEFESKKILVERGASRNVDFLLKKLQRRTGGVITIVHNVSKFNPWRLEGELNQETPWLAGAQQFLSPGAANNNNKWLLHH